MKSNLILIGMAGSGKSTIGQRLAKKLGYEFLDSDRVVEAQEGKRLQETLDEEGVPYFKKAEEKAILSIDVKQTVIATGGSVIYSDKAMQHLRKDGICIWLDLPYEVVEARIDNLATRGIAIDPGKTLRDVYEERQPLYEKYADIRIDCTSSPEAAVTAIMGDLKLFK